MSLQPSLPKIGLATVTRLMTFLLLAVGGLQSEDVAVAVASSRCGHCCLWLSSDCTDWYRRARAGPIRGSTRSTSASLHVPRRLEGFLAIRHTAREESLSAMDVLKQLARTLNTEKETVHRVKYEPRSDCLRFDTAQTRPRPSFLSPTFKSRSRGGVLGKS